MAARSPMMTTTIMISTSVKAAAAAGKITRCLTGNLRWQSVCLLFLL